METNGKNKKKWKKMEKIEKKWKIMEKNEKKLKKMGKKWKKLKKMENKGAFARRMNVEAGSSSKKFIIDLLYTYKHIYTYLIFNFSLFP